VEPYAVRIIIPIDIICVALQTLGGAKTL